MYIYIYYILCTYILYIMYIYYILCIYILYIMYIYYVYIYIIYYLAALSTMSSSLSIFLFQISQEISKKYKNRPVNIMGEINTI